MSVCAKIDKVMADYIMLRKGRNALSTLTHVILNILLAVVSTALTVVSGNWVFGVLLVVLSKWRVVAVRPRYWWLNIKANLVDFIVGISLVLLVYLSGSDGLNAWHVVFTFFYIIWLVIIKPQSSTIMTEIQALAAIFLGNFAITMLAAAVDPIVSVGCALIVGYGACRHVLVQGEDHDFMLATFIFSLLNAELSWILFHWSIIYRVTLLGATFAIPQQPILSALMFFVFARGYKSAVRHDGKIRSSDLTMPAIFSALIMLVMIFFYSAANFNI
jgi:hypothetical protein